MKYAPTACIHAGSFPQRITRKNKRSSPPPPREAGGGGKPKLFMYILNRVRLILVKRVGKECKVSISPKKEEKGFNRKVRIGRVCAGKE